MEEEELMHENAGVGTAAFPFQRQLKRASESNIFSNRSKAYKKLKKTSSLPSLTQSPVEEHTSLESSESINRRPLTVSLENQPERKGIWSVKRNSHAETLPSALTESLGNLVAPEELNQSLKRSHKEMSQGGARRSTRIRKPVERMNIARQEKTKRPKIKPKTKPRRKPERPHEGKLTIGERQAMFTPDEVVTLRIEGDAEFLGKMRFLKKAERLSKGTLKFQPGDDFNESIKDAEKALSLSFKDWHEGRNFHHLLPVEVARKLKLTYKQLNILENAISLRKGLPLESMKPKPQKINGEYKRQSKEVYLEISKSLLSSNFIKHKAESDTKLERFFKKSQHRLFNLGHHNYNLYVEKQLNSGTTSLQLLAVIDDI